MSDILRVGGTVNAVVVQLPERQNLGVVIQRDSLQNLLKIADDARKSLKGSDLEECGDLLDEINELLSGYVGAFET